MRLKIGKNGFKNGINSQNNIKLPNIIFRVKYCFKPQKINTINLLTKNECFLSRKYGTLKYGSRKI